jgi:hypothetical protein
MDFSGVGSIPAAFWKTRGVTEFRCGAKGCAMRPGSSKTQSQIRTLLRSEKSGTRSSGRERHLDSVSVKKHDTSINQLLARDVGIDKLLE